MIAYILLFLVSAGDQAPQANVTIERSVVYEKDTTVDLSKDGSMVDGEVPLPPAFFLMKNSTPRARSLLLERLNFVMRGYNPLGF